MVHEEEGEEEEGHISDIEHIELDQMGGAEHPPPPRDAEARRNACPEDAEGGRNAASPSKDAVATSLERRQPEQQQSLNMPPRLLPRTGFQRMRRSATTASHRQLAPVIAPLARRGELISRVETEEAEAEEMPWIDDDQNGNGEEEDAAFSPRLDIDLGPQLETQKVG